MATGIGRQIPRQRATFRGGMNQDTPPELLAGEQYVDARNVHLVQTEQVGNQFTDGTSFTGRQLKITNVKGQTLSFTFPSIPAYTQRLVLYITGLTFTGATGTYTSTVNLGGGFVFTGTATAAEGWGVAIQRMVDAMNADAVFGVNFITAIIPTSTFNASTLTLDTSVQFGVSYQINIFAKSPIGGTISLVSGGVSNSSPAVSYNYSQTLVQNSPAINTPTIIGYRATDTECIIFTTDVNNYYAGNDTYAGGTPCYGQIWLLDITQHTTSINCSLSRLIYNDAIGTARNLTYDVDVYFENNCIRRVLWADDYHPPRALQIPSKGLSSLSPKQLAFNPELSWANFVPLTNISGGLRRGVYQYTYRYINSDGTPTSWFALSNHVIITSAPSATNYKSSKNTGQQTNQGVRLYFNALDTRFARIQVAYVYFTQKQLPADTVAVCFDGEIVSDAITIDHTDNVVAGTTPITYDELTVPISFTSKAKNLAIVGNRSVVSNYCESDISAKVDTSGITRSFVTTEIASDGLPILFTTVGRRISEPAVGSPAQLFTIPSGSLFPYGSFYALNDTRNQTGLTTEYNLRGYWRGETYRFGILLWFKNGRYGYVDHIADVKFPNQYDAPEYAVNGTVSGGSPIAPIALRALGVVFNNIIISSELASQISGFSIVRAPRIKSAIAQGIVVKSDFPTTPGNDQVYRAIMPELDFQQEVLQNSYSFEALYGTAVDSGYSGEPPGINIGGLVMLSKNYVLFSGTLAPGTNWNTFTSLGYVKGSVPLRGLYITGWALNGVNGTLQPGVARPSQIGNNAFPQPVLWNLRKPFSGYGPKETTLYQWCGHYQPVSAAGNYRALVYGGDTFVNYYSRIVSFYTGNPADGRTNVNVMFPCESTINTALRYQETGYLTETQADLAFGNGNIDEDWLYANAFSQEPAATLLARPKLATSCAVCHPNDGIASKVQVAGSSINNLVSLQPNETFTTTPIYGSITHMVPISATDVNNLYVWQALAFSRVPVQAYGLQLSNSVQIQLGTGTFFGQPLYINETTGTQHKNSVHQYKKRFYWWDAANGRFMRFAQNGVEDISLLGKMLAFSQNNFSALAPVDNPAILGGMLTTYDTLHDEVLFTSRQLSQNYTLNSAYNSSKYNGSITQIVINGVQILPAAVPFSEGIVGIRNFLNDYLPSLGYTGAWSNNGSVLSVSSPSFTPGLLDFSGDIYQPSPAIGATQTLAFNEQLNAFVSFHTPTPYIYLRLPGNRLLSPNPSSPRDVYRHFDNNTRNAFYGSSTPVESYIIWVLNEQVELSKNASHFILDANEWWDYLEMLTFQQKDVLGGNYQLRGKRFLTGALAADIAQQARSGRLQVNAPIGTDISSGEPPVWSNNVTMQRFVGNQFLIKLGTSSANLRELLYVDGYFTINKRTF